LAVGRSTFEIFNSNLAFYAKLTDLEGFELTKLFYHKGTRRFGKGRKATFEVFNSNLGFYAKTSDLEGLS
jgi:hypothetical protein